jgi:hypothetical protein
MPGLRGDQHARAQAAFGDCLADDFFQTAETIDWSGIDDINGMSHRGVNGGNLFGFIGSAPHPAAYGPGPDCDARNLQRRTGNVGQFHVFLESLCLTNHHLILCFELRPSVPCRPSRRR